MGNVADNMFSAMALMELYKQVEQAHPDKLREAWPSQPGTLISPETFQKEMVYSSGLNGIRPKLIQNGPDKGKLTLEDVADDGTIRPLQGINPVPYADLLGTYKDLATAVNSQIGK